jgi:hypothetical protein
MQLRSLQILVNGTSHGSCEERFFLGKHKFGCIAFAPRDSYTPALKETELSAFPLFPSACERSTAKLVFQGK